MWNDMWQKDTSEIRRLLGGMLTIDFEFVDEIYINWNDPNSFRIFIIDLVLIKLCENRRNLIIKIVDGFTWHQERPQLKSEWRVKSFESKKSKNQFFFSYFLVNCTIKNLDLEKKKKRKFASHNSRKIVSFSCFFAFRTAPGTVQISDLRN